MCKKSIKNSQPFVRKMRNVRTPREGIFFDSHCMYIANFVQIGKTICQQTDVWTNVRMDIETGLIRSPQRSQHENKTVTGNGTI